METPSCHPTLAKWDSTTSCSYDPNQEAHGASHEPPMPTWVMLSLYVLWRVFLPTLSDIVCLSPWVQVVWQLQTWNDLLAVILMVEWAFISLDTPFVVPWDVEPIKLSVLSWMFRSRVGQALIQRGLSIWISGIKCYHYHKFTNTKYAAQTPYRSKHNKSSDPWLWFNSYPAMYLVAIVERHMCFNLWNFL